MLIAILIFSNEMVGNGLPDSGRGSQFCLIRSDECIQARRVIAILMAVSAGFGILIGYAYLSNIAAWKQIIFPWPKKEDMSC